MRIVETTVYTINDHPNRELCFEWMRNNRHDLNEHMLYEVEDSIKALKKIIGGDIKYQIGQYPDGNDFISWTGYDTDSLWELDACDLPLTGTWADYIVIVGLRHRKITEFVCRNLKESWESIYSDEGLAEHCEVNEFEFTADGTAF